ncbi:DUF4349 domain-containing protein [Nocardioidaceae bacterium]|nr:DUF4349 domain-containing protein [Nocardioidaceae bacterium]
MTATTTPRPGRRPGSRPALAYAALVAAGAFALGACSGGAETPAGVAGAPSTASMDDGISSQRSFGAGESLAGTAETAYDSTARVPVNRASAVEPGDISDGRSIIRTGRLDLTADDVPGVRADLVTEIASLGGEVASEESEGDRQGRLRRVLLVAEVPTESFADAMDAFAGLARTTSRSSDATDVTEEVVDVAARVRTQAAAVRRMEDLLDRADTIGEVIRVENQLVRRQAALEALQARQESLAQKTSSATIRVDLQRAAPSREETDRSPVQAGLVTGWDAFGDATRSLVVLVATALPFLVTAALLGAPLLWWRRRRTA